jgi:hypothetical protein
MTLSNGVLTQRQTCEAEICDAPPIQTAASTETLEFSSQMNIDNLDQLKSVKIKEGESFIIFQVFGVGRYKQTPSRHGTVVVLYTHLGEITLDGTAVSFHESIAGAFSRAGLTIDQSTNRRLVGAAKVIGESMAVITAQIFAQIPTQRPSCAICQCQSGDDSHKCNCSAR